MTRNRSFIVLAALLAAGTAEAADLYSPAHMHQLGAPYAAESPLRHYYVRGDVGVARHSLGALSQAELAENGGSFISKSIEDAALVGAGFGWQVNRHLRFDFTGEYRARTGIAALDNLKATIANPDGDLIANTHYTGNLSAIVGLLNGYIDLATWRGITPYVGGGIGFARTSMSGFTTMSAATFTDATSGEFSTQLSSGTGGAKSEINLAWALMAGISVDIGNRAKLDLGYRYLNLGSNLAATTGLLDCVCGPVGQPLKVADLDAHEFRVGIRVPLNDPAPELFHRPLK